jgi:hypothetical protein
VIDLSRAWTADEGEARWSSIKELCTSGGGGDPGFSESKQVNVTRFSEVMYSREFERIE